MTYKVRTPAGIVAAERVTQVIRSVLAAPALERWKLEQVATHASALTAEGTWRSPAHCISSWERMSQSAANRGSRVHAWITAALCGADLPSVSMSDKPLCDAFLGWLVDHPWQTLGTEVTVTTRDRPLVAGTMDGLFADADDVILCDWKTTKTAPDLPYLDHEAQIGAYASLPHRLGATGTIGPRVPKVTRAVVVYLTPEGARPLDVNLWRATAAWTAILTLHQLRSR